VDAAVDAALAAWPSLPGDRLAILGHSFGMTAALLIATRSDRYRSYVLRAGTSDMFSKWGEFAPAARTSPQEGFMFRNQQGWTEVGQGALGGPPWANVEAYAAASPYLASDHIRSPMLLIGADRDFVALSQTEQMFSALHRLGGHARLLTYWGEEHMVWSPANIRDQYREILIWLDRTLGPAGTLAARPTRSSENSGQPAS
jgi:dipeptidyl aminopeptidase/acylaminoacyl peptidase